MKTLLVVRGLPGSGKSTLAHTLTDKVYSADMFFEDDKGNYRFEFNKLTAAHSWCQKAVENEMKEATSIVAVANTFTREWEMKPYFDMAKKYGYTVHSIIVENRHNGKNVHGVPSEVIEKMKSRFEVSL